jgi:hypothetical protein
MENLFELALSELQDLQTRFPDDQRVAKLIPIVQVRLDQRQLSTDPSPAGDKDGRPDKSGKKRSPAERGWPANRLTQEQVNLIRVFEIDLKEKPGVVLPTKVIDELFKYYEQDHVLTDADRREFKSLKGWRQLEHMFSLVPDYPQVRSLYKDVKVRDEPPAMLTFRTRIHLNYVLNYCGTVGCHGGSEGGDLQLFRERPTHVATIYTNFFMLDSYKTKSRHEMIDREVPEKSLLIQYAQPSADALEPHPEVEGWTPLLRSRPDNRRNQRAQIVIDWIKSLQKMPSNYLVDFKPAKPEKKGDSPDKTTGGPDAGKATPVQ